RDLRPRGADRRARREATDHPRGLRPRPGRSTVAGAPETGGFVSGPELLQRRQRRVQQRRQAQAAEAVGGEQGDAEGEVDPPPPQRGAVRCARSRWTTSRPKETTSRARARATTAAADGTGTTGTSAISSATP